MASVDLSVIASGVAVVAGGYAALLRYTLKREREQLEEKIRIESTASKDAHNSMKARVDTVENDARVRDAEIAAALAKANADLGAALAKANSELTSKFDAALARIVEMEKESIRQDGVIALLKQAHDDAARALDEIKKQQVPRAEWERQMAMVEKTLTTILERLDERDVRAKNGGG